MAVLYYARSGFLVVTAMLLGCGGATRGASAPQKTTTTAASMAPQIERLLVSEPGQLSLVARKGCVATLRTADTQTGANDELRVRCPKPERLTQWFDATSRVMASFAYEPAREEREGEDEDKSEVDTKSARPWAKVLTASGKTLKVARAEDVSRVAAELRLFSVELAKAEEPSPGPASPAGWQMLHVTGPAHVMFAGTPTRGFFEARVSTSGQYLCEFITNVEDSPLRATKSGWIAPQVATHAIDEVLVPFNAVGANERAKGTYAAGTTDGAERRSNAPSTAAVFERFAQMQDALGDACLPELEAPPAASVGL